MISWPKAPKMAKPPKSGFAPAQNPTPKFMKSFCLFSCLGTFYSSGVGHQAMARHRPPGALGKSPCAAAPAGGKGRQRLRPRRRWQQPQKHL
mmetsp:Transcript_35055/g.43280  ORF Transcript_35055/g.43280 Transcript_35055/m.43280 type:complete len:92 (+) Transcript_35055:671-946(+)